jgi:hypothetical protein
MLIVSNGWARVREGVGEGEEAVRSVFSCLSPQRRAGVELIILGDSARLKRSGGRCSEMPRGRPRRKEGDCGMNSPRRYV